MKIGWTNLCVYGNCMVRGCQREKGAPETLIEPREAVSSALNEKSMIHNDERLLSVPLQEIGATFLCTCDVKLTKRRMKDQETRVKNGARLMEVNLN